MKLLQQLRGHFPSKLPHTEEDFNKFCESIFSVYNLPDKLSYRRAIATMILHLGPLENKKSKIYFVKSIEKARMNEFAFDQMQAFKKLEQQEAEEAKEKAIEEPSDLKAISCGIPDTSATMV